MCCLYYTPIFSYVGMVNARITASIVASIFDMDAVPGI